MSEWLRPDEAAVWLRTTVGNVHVIAHRRGWRREGAGRSLRYWFDDVDHELSVRNGTIETREDPGTCVNRSGA